MSFDSFFENGPMTHIWFMTYAIYTSYDLKFYFWFSKTKILEIRPRKNFKSAFLSNARAESNFNFQFEFNVKFRVEWFALI